MEKNTNENTIEILELEKEIKQKDKKIRILLIINIILIILLLLIYFLGYRLGKIGQVSTNVPSVSYKDIIEVTDENIEWDKIDKDLEIFNNSKFNNESIIAPNSSETYEFIVKNTTDQNVGYKIEFEDESNYNINMKYKLKLENVYIAGSESEWVSLEELSEEAVKIAKNSSNIFTLEWKWVDNDEEDTFIGMQKDGVYTLKISIKADVI